MTLILKLFRKKHRMSRERLADLLGVSLSTVTRMEKREHEGREIPERYRLAVEALERKMSHTRLPTIAYGLDRTAEEQR